MSYQEFKADSHTIQAIHVVNSAKKELHPSGYFRVALGENEATWSMASDYFRKGADWYDVFGKHAAREAIKALFSRSFNKPQNPTRRMLWVKYLKLM